jgi:hypothetical protein
MSEAGVLNFLLSAEFPGVDSLRAQVEGLVVVGRCDCGCPMVDLSTAAEAVAADALEQRVLPVDAVIAPLGDEPPGEVIVFADNGLLSGLEYVYYDDTPPAGWPDPSRLALR